jgi:UDP-glucose 4-epimerase
MILVTGASGFVGRCLVSKLAQLGIATRACVRTDPQLPHEHVEVVSGVDLLTSTDLSPLLTGVSVVIHTAARVHVMQEQSQDPLADFRLMNVTATLNLARAAAQAGVKRFVFVSTIKVNGEFTLPGQKYTADMPPNPHDAYGISKLEAEQGLFNIARQTGLEVVVVRAPLVYGPGVKANFAKMMRWIKLGIPLPFGRVLANRRSMVGLDNLVDLLVVCIRHPAAVNQIFLVSDGEDLSTATLLQRLGVALGAPARLLPIPEGWLRWSAKLTGQGALSQRLLDNLQVDMTKTTELLGWNPPFTIDEGLRKTVEGFVK